MATTAHLQAFKILKVEARKASSLVHFVAGPRVARTLGACLARERAVCDALCAAPDQMADRVATALEKAKEAEGRAKKLQGELVGLLAESLAASSGKVVAAPPREAAKDMAEIGKALATAFEQKRPDAVLVQTFGGGAFLLSASTKELLDVAKEPLLAVMGGKGGGNAGRFQGKGADAGKVAEAVAAAAAALGG